MSRMILTEETIHICVRRYLNNYVDGVYRRTYN